MFSLVWMRMIFYRITERWLYWLPFTITSFWGLCSLFGGTHLFSFYGNYTEALWRLRLIFEKIFLVFVSSGNHCTCAATKAFVEAGILSPAEDLLCFGLPSEAKHQLNKDVRSFGIHGCKGSRVGQESPGGYLCVYSQRSPPYSSLTVLYRAPRIRTLSYRRRGVENFGVIVVKKFSLMTIDR